MPNYPSPFNSFAFIWISKKVCIHGFLSIVDSVSDNKKLNRKTDVHFYAS
jgi:hypothetical protein